MRTRKDAGIFLVTVWKSYSRDLTSDTYELIMTSLAELEPDEIMRALAVYVKNPKNDKPPNAANIIALARPEVSVEDISTVTAARVLEAVSRFGWTNGSAARDYVGPMGWDAIRALGGWGFVCRNLGDKLNVATVQAQIRNLCSAKQNLLAAGKDPLAIQHKPQGQLCAPKGEEEDV